MNNSKLRKKIFELIEEYTSETGEFVTTIDLDVYEEYSIIHQKRWQEYGRINIRGQKISLNTRTICHNGEEVVGQNINLHA